MNFLHTFSPNPILLDLGFITVRWYGFFIALALLVGIWLAIKIAKENNINSDDIYSLALYGAIFGIIGARMYEVFFINWYYYQENLINIFAIWHGGLAIHGVIIAGLVTLIIFGKIKKIPFLVLADLAVILLPLGQAIGRWGNYFNQELFGWPTSLPWGIPIDLINRPSSFINQQYFHPVFLYESILNLILFLILFLVYKKIKLGRGILLAIYLIGYGLIRFLMEFVRIDLTPIYWVLRFPQWVSIGMMILGSLILVKITLKSNIKN